RVYARRLANDFPRAACRNHPAPSTAFTTVPLPPADAALAELERGLDPLGMVGVTLGCSIAGRPLDDPRLDPFFAELNRRGTVVFLHPVGRGVLEGEDPFGLAWMVGAPFEDTVAALSLIMSGLTRRYPDIRFIVPHLGGTLPFLLARLNYSGAIRRATATGLSLEGGLTPHLRRLWYDTVSTHPEALCCACGSFGVDRLLLG